jgi:hypothetical protein
VLAPAISLAQDTNESTLKSKVEEAIGKIKGSTSDKNADVKSGNQNSAATSAGDTNYPDRAAVKKSDK